MICGNCGTDIKDGSLFCKNCGSKVDEFNVEEFNVEENLGFLEAGVENKEEKQTSYQKVADTMNDEDYANSVSYISSTKAKEMVTASEVPLYSLSNGLLNHIVTGRGWSSNDAVITNRRLYYHCSTGLINKSTDEEMVDIADITGTKICNNNPIWILGLSVIAFLVSIICHIKSPVGYDGVFIIAAVGLLIFYFILRNVILRIQYAGGEICFNVKNFGMNQIRTFQRTIYAVKEENAKKEAESRK